MKTDISEQKAKEELEKGYEAAKKTLEDQDKPSRPRRASGFLYSCSKIMRDFTEFTRPL